MNENVKKIHDFIKEAPFYGMSTVEDGEPKVRPFDSIHIFEDKLYFLTSKKKNVYTQMKNHSEVQITTAHKDGHWLRMIGHVEEDTRREARKSFLDSVEDYTHKYDVDDGVTTVFYYKDAKATFYTPKDEPTVVEI